MFSSTDSCVTYPLLAFQSLLDSIDVVTLCTPAATSSLYGITLHEMCVIDLTHDPTGCNAHDTLKSRLN